MWKYLVAASFMVVTSSNPSVAVNSESAENPTIQCIDDHGNNVDWFVIYKFPSETYDGYMFVTSKTADQGWIISNRTMEDADNMISKTISRMYENDEKEMWLAYNDNWWWFNRGHAKGIIGGRSDGGIWLVHSIPHFPKSKRYGYPSSGKRNAQGALCITLATNELDKVGDALTVSVPHYDLKKFGSSLNDVYPKLRSALNSKKSQENQIEFNLTSKAGQEFVTFAKSKSYGKDIYEWIASSLESDLYVQTWRTALKPFRSTCDGPRKIINVNAVEYKPKSLRFSYTKDHSKWAIATVVEKPFVCVGDINRAKHQLKRGGGSVCTSHPQIWQAFYSIIVNVDSC